MNENNQSLGDEVEIDLGEIFGVLLHWAWLLVLITLLCGIAGYCVSAFLLPEQFESTTQIYVLNRQDDDNGKISTQDLQAGSALTNDYASIITSRYVLEKVIADLKLDYDYDGLMKHVKVTTPSDTRIVAITVTDTSPEAAKMIADEIRTDASDHIKEVMAINAVNVVEEANLPTEKSSPNNTKNAAIAALVGLFLTAAIIVIRYIMDDTIKTQEDVEKYLGLSTLAMIPIDEEISKNSFEEMGKKSKKKTKKAAHSAHHAAETNALHHSDFADPNEVERPSRRRERTAGRSAAAEHEAVRNDRPRHEAEHAAAAGARRPASKKAESRPVNRDRQDKISDETDVITISDI